MKKFIRFILILVSVVIVALLVLTMVEPNDVTVTRSTIVAAPVDMVFPQLADFRNWPNWSTWQRKDSAIKLTYSGTPGEAGSSYRWVGDENLVGEGEMKIRSIGNDTVVLDIDILKPIQSQATSGFALKTIKGGTKVTWTLYKHINFPYNAALVFVDIDKLLGGDFEAALTELKNYVEGHYTAPPVVVVKETVYPQRLYAGVRQTVRQDALISFFDMSYMVAARVAAGNISGPATAIFYGWDTASRQTDVAAVFPVRDTLKAMKGVWFTALPATAAFMAGHTGGYAGSKQVHDAIMSYMVARGLQPGIAIEEYITGPAQQPDSNKWETNIYYFAK